MTTTIEKITFSLDQEKSTKNLLMATSFTGTKEETLKELFKDLIIEIPEGKEVKYALASASSSRDLFQIILPIDPIENDETQRIRIDASKIKGILNNLENKIKIENTDKYIKIFSEKSSIKIHKSPAEMLKEQFDILKIEKDKEKITTIEANKLLQCISQTAFIPLSEKTGNPLEITFSKEDIKTISVQSEGHFAAVGKINHPCQIETKIMIPAYIVPKLINILKALKNKAIEIFTNKNQSKIQIKSTILSYTFYTEEKTLPDVYSMKENLDSIETSEILVNIDEILKALDLINFINGETTIVKINSFNNKIKIKTTEGEEVEKEIDAICEENQEIIATVKVLQKTIKTYLYGTEEKQVKIKLHQNELVYKLNHPEEEYPCIMFAGAKK